MPLHKSEEGWRRLNKRVRANRGVHCARMDYRPRKPLPRSTAGPVLVEQTLIELDDVAVELPSDSRQFPTRRRFSIED